MKTGYIIRAEGTNPEFDTSEDLRQGVQADGFLLLTIRDGKPHMECINGMTVMELARFFGLDTEVCSILRQAAAIGDGFRNAEKVRNEDLVRIKKKGIARGLPVNL